MGMPHELLTMMHHDAQQLSAGLAFQRMPQHGIRRIRAPAREGDFHDGLPPADRGGLRAGLLDPRVPALREYQRQAARLTPRVVVRAAGLTRRRLLQIPVQRQR